MFKINRVFPVIFVLCSLGFFLAGCSQQENAPPLRSSKPHNIRAMAVTAGTGFQEVIEISGPLAPVQGTDLAAEDAGAVVAILRDKGSRVDLGDILVEQDRTILAAALKGAESSLATRKFNLEKLTSLFEAEKISRFEWLQAKDDMTQAEAQVEIATRRFERAAIRAPFAGVVVDRFVELGQYLLPGQKVARLIDPFTLKLLGYLTDEQVGLVTLGQTCFVEVGSQGRTVPGTLSFVSLEADLQTGKFKVEVEIPNPDLGLRSGVIGRARLPLLRTNEVAIPRDAILSSLDGAAVYVVHGENAQRQKIALGADMGLMVAVRAGLTVGDTLVVRGQRRLRDGSLVHISQWSFAPDGSLPEDPALSPQVIPHSEVPSIAGEKP